MDLDIFPVSTAGPDLHTEPVFREGKGNNGIWSIGTEFRTPFGPLGLGLQQKGEGWS